MKIFPAIDIKNGKCVRLLKGDFNQQTIYEQSPLEQAKKYKDHGFENIHIIDLDGALKGSPINMEIVELIASKLNMNIQVGGGIRSMDTIKKYFDIGVKQVILGSIAIKKPLFFEQACEKFKNKITLALDTRKGDLAISGWKEQTKHNVKDFTKKVSSHNFARIIYTDIDRDGTKLGPDIKGSIDIAKDSNKSVIISGGVSSINDIKEVKKLNHPMIEGIIVGKAIYDKNINLSELVKLI